MFEMSANQIQAFQNATDGISADTFCRTILFLIGLFATIWLMLIFIGTIKSNKKSIFESVYEFSFAVCVYIMIGVLIYYT